MDKAKEQDLFRNTIRLQLILSVALVHAVLMSIFVWDLLTRQKELILQRQIDEATALSKSIATSTSGWVASNDYIGIQEIISAQTRYPELRFAMVMNDEGKIISHSDISKIGMYLKHELPQKKETTLISQSPTLVDTISPIFINSKHIGWVRIGLGEIDMSKKINRITTNGIIYATAAILLGSVIAWLTGTSLTKRLYQIEKVAIDISKGKMDSRVDVQGSDEITTVCRTFNNMLDKLDKSKEDQLLSNERLSLAVKASKTGVWDYDLINGTLIWDESMYEIYDIKESKFNNAYDAWRSVVHPDDLDEAKLALKEAISGIKPFDETFRILDSNQEVKWIKAFAKVLFNEKGVPYRMIGTNKDISQEINFENELKKRNSELQVASEMANAGSVARSQFLATISHELRTPMNGVLGMVDLLRETDLNEEQSKYLDVINSSGKTLLAVINDVLDFSKLDSSQLKLAHEVFNLEDAVESVVSLLKVNANLKNLKLNYQIDKNTPILVNSDENRIKQILFNLIGNSVKFTNKGEIDVNVSFIERFNKIGNLIIEVKDTGIGISEKQQKDLFTPFVQGEGSTKRTYSGTGLGLSIVKKITDVFGGKIDFESKLDEGATFKVSIPIEVADKITESSKKTEKKKQLSEVKVLIAEDTVDNQKVLLAMLSDPCYQITVVDDGQKALDEFMKQDFDIILIDCHMPKMSGEEAIKHMRSVDKESKKNIPILAISANTQIEFKEKIIKAGANDFLLKPFKKSILEDQIQNYLG